MRHSATHQDHRTWTHSIFQGPAQCCAATPPANLPKRSLPSWYMQECFLASLHSRMMCMFLDVLRMSWLPRVSALGHKGSLSVRMFGPTYESQPCR
jgi:hypothetical protein